MTVATGRSSSCRPPLTRGNRVTYGSTRGVCSAFRRLRHCGGAGHGPGVGHVPGFPEKGPDTVGAFTWAADRPKPGREARARVGEIAVPGDPAELADSIGARSGRLSVRRETPRPGQSRLSDILCPPAAGRPRSTNRAH